MCHQQRHRGPDSRGIHLDGQAGLGIQRLRVIDLETGDQPIFNEDGTVAVVLNGEIYNFRELREACSSARAPIRDPGRHRGDRAPLRGAGRRLRALPERDVRPRDLGLAVAGVWCSRATGSARSPSSTRCTAGRSELRVGASGAASGPGDPAMSSTTGRSTPTWRSAGSQPPSAPSARCGSCLPRARSCSNGGGLGSSAIGSLDYARKRRDVRHDEPRSLEEFREQNPTRRFGGG